MWGRSALNVTLDDHVLDQLNVKVNGRRVGYTRKGGEGVVVWLCDDACRLTEKERAAVQDDVKRLMKGDDGNERETEGVDAG